jgi:TonB family protein
MSMLPGCVSRFFAGFCFAAVVVMVIARGGAAFAQAPVAGGQAGAEDQVRWAAESLVGKALFLRGFYLTNDLKYDAAGRVQGAPKKGEWTLAAVNVLKVQPQPGEIELDGVRVAIRYNADQHQFERHPLNDEKVRIVVACPDMGAGGVKGFETAVAAILAVGIDPELQRAMPDYWQHYFNPALEWPQDGLTGVTVYPTYGLPNQTKDVASAKAEHKAEAKFTSFAERDRVKGPILLQVVVDPEGVPRRTSVMQPLGYGLEAEAVAAMTKWRFAPGTREGKPVATGLVVAQEFEFVAAPGR